MTQLCWTRVCLAVGVLAVSCSPQREFVPLFPRSERSLVDTFPFSQETGELPGLPGRQLRQGDLQSNSISFDEVAEEYGNSGQRCIEKVFMEEVMEYDTLIKCDHSYNRRCAKSLKTTYTAAQEEECEDNYVKNCFIEYSAFANNVTATVCRTPLVKDCDKQGEEVCSTQYESECVTEQEKHEVTDDVVDCRTILEEKCEEDTSGYTTNTRCSKWPREECAVIKKPVTKFTPITKCTKQPVELCGPSGCGFKEGEEECQEKTQTVVGDRPEETCSLDPQRSCKHVTKLIPALKEVENCFDVPKEVCVRSESNPRKVQKPVVKKWCYVPTCPQECQTAAANGECLDECRQYEGIDKCCAPCPKTCLDAARSRDTCSGECKQYKDKPKCCYIETTTTTPTTTTTITITTARTTTPTTQPVIVEKTCKDIDPDCYRAALRKQCSNECYSKYGGAAKGTDDYKCCGKCCPDKCEAAAKSKRTDRDCCDKYESCGSSCCYREPTRTTTTKRSLTCKDIDPDCYRAAQRNQCSNECYSKYGGATVGSDDYLCCGTCPQICKDYASRGETYANRTLNCGDFTGRNDKGCFASGCCPDKCESAAKSKRTDRDCCDKYESSCGSSCCYREPITDPTTTTRPTTTTVRTTTPKCPDKCERAIKEKTKDQSCCSEYGSRCCYQAKPCPAKCVFKSPCLSSQNKPLDVEVGVQECDNVPGCCPERFDVVFGAGVYLPPPEED